jgi:hypothetical protein
MKQVLSKIDIVSLDLMPMLAKQLSVLHLSQAPVAEASRLAGLLMYLYLRAELDTMSALKLWTLQLAQWQAVSTIAQRKNLALQCPQDILVTGVAYP